MSEHRRIVPGRRPALRGGVPQVNRLAAQVIRSATRERPADRALREFFKERGELKPGQMAEISRGVFAYYRWRGWLSNEKGIERRIERAQELAKRFERNPFSLPAEALRAKAVPIWVAGEMDVNDAWLRTLQREPVLWLRAKTGQGRVLGKRLKHAKTGPLPDSLLYQGKEDLYRRDEFQAGEFEIQDISSQAVGFLCDPKPGEKWWDVCAGEGGKTLHLAEKLEGRGVVVATDHSERRLSRLKVRAARAGVFNYQVFDWSGEGELPVEFKFDGVLVDAPCSGLGTWQKNPHARWTTTLDDVRELAAVQKRLLSLAAKSVRAGGRLVYSVCTLTRSETESVVQAFSSEHPAFKPLPLNHPFVDGAVSPTHCIWPQQSRGGGMFVAAWRKGGEVRNPRSELRDPKERSKAEI